MNAWEFWSDCCMRRRSDMGDCRAPQRCRRSRCEAALTRGRYYQKSAVTSTTTLFTPRSISAETNIERARRTDAIAPAGTRAGGGHCAHRTAACEPGIRRSGADLGTYHFTAKGVLGFCALYRRHAGAPKWPQTAYDAITTADYTSGATAGKFRGLSVRECLVFPDGIGPRALT